MKATKKQVEGAILFFANKFGKEENFKAILSISTTDQVVQMIVYEMFLYGFNTYYCTDEEYEQHKLIYKYATELKQNGYVDFEL